MKERWDKRREESREKGRRRKERRGEKMEMKMSRPPSSISLIFRPIDQPGGERAGSAGLEREVAHETRLQGTVP